MKFKFFYTNERIFWNNDSIDKPSHTLNYNWIEIENINFNQIDNDYAQVYLKNPQDYKYFKVVDTENNKAKYYFYDKILKFDKEGKLVLIVLDVWNSYWNEVLTSIWHVKFEIERTHIDNELNFMYNDPMIDNLNLIQKEDTQLISYEDYTSLNGENLYKNKFNLQSGCEVTISPNEAISGNYYYIFKGEESIHAYPVMSTDKAKVKKWSLAEPDLWGTRSYRLNIATSISQNEIFTDGVGEYFQNELNVLNNPIYFFKKFYIKDNEKNKIYNFSPVANLNDRPEFYTFSHEKTLINSPGYYEDSQTFRVYYLGKLFTTKKIYDDLSTNISIVAELYRQDNQLNSSVEVYNNSEFLEKLKNKSDYITRFQGIYFLPNYVNFLQKANIILKDSLNYMYVDIPFNGIDIKMNLGQLEISNDSIILNDTPKIYNKITYNYMNFTYYGNPIEVNHYLNENNEIIITGKFVFSGNGNIIVNNKYLKTSQSIIQYPYQLPSTYDEYDKYIASTMSSVNTGLQQAKENLIFGSVNTGINAGLSGGGISSLLNSGMSIGNSGMGYAHQVQSLNAKRADARRTMGASFAATNIKDTSYLLSNYANNLPCEILEYNKLSDASLSLLNSVLYYYGNYYPNLTYLSDMILTNDVTYPFRFIKFNNMYLFQSISFRKFYYQFENKSVVDKIINALSNGVRIWNQKN